VAVLTITAPGFSAESAGPLVRVRVEGKTQTIFGATEPRALAATALEALEVASSAGEFYYHVQDAGFGPYVDQIGRHSGSGSSGWVFKVNGASPPVGADKVELKAGDVVLWYWATFTDAGGPTTLGLRSRFRNCYAVTQQDDTGTETGVREATFHVNGKTFLATTTSPACIGAHRTLVWVSVPGAVRSNAVR
jgi:hypothetical protein